MNAEGPDVDLIRRCLRAVVEGPFVDDWEFHTLFGLTRAEVAEVWRAWPERLADTGLAVNNTVAHLWGYPHGLDAQLREWTGADEQAMRAALDRWRASSPGPGR